MTSGRRKYLLIGVDGLRVDDVGGRIAAPAIEQMLAKGRVARMRMEVPTLSGPGWASILTGATHADHGVVDNSFSGHAMHRNPDLLSRTFYADHATTTFAAAGWPPLVDPLLDPVISFRADQQRHGQHHVVIRNGESYGYRSADGEVAAATLAQLDAHGAHGNFVYFCEGDEAAHLHGGTSSEYADALARIDEHIRRLLDVVGRRAAAHDEDWLVGLTTDHGHLDEGGHGGGEDVVTRSFLALLRFHGAAPAGNDGVDLPDVIEPREVWRTFVEHVVGR